MEMKQEKKKEKEKEEDEEEHPLLYSKREPNRKEGWENIVINANNMPTAWPEHARDDPEKKPTNYEKGVPNK